MKIYEYRVILPTNVPQYQIGNLYMCAQRTRETQGGGEGIEILKNEPYQEGEEKGQYTHKVMHFKSKVPGAIRWAIPDKYLHIDEKSHNSYPHFHTLYEQKGMGKDFYLLVESQHMVYDREKGVPDNALNLTPEELKQRQIFYLDIVNSKPKPEKPEWDMHNFECPEAKISKLSTPKNTCDETKPPEWTLTYEGDMIVAVKIVKFKFKWFGIQSAVESFAMGKFHDVFLDSHRAMFSWAAQWFPMDMPAIRKLEQEVQDEQAKLKFDKDEESESKSKKDDKKKDDKKAEEAKKEEAKPEEPKKE
ncbi:Phosphatidylinositol transfer protein [Trichomonas vaginalis G3]|uniref:Phosphatidylinositol transfer protein n=1 Tax=Trichomonas vaginalis (strain ATCC PRA-98 / G3) TaxID=412133 RepID=A2DD35_TRIV3|nr:phosphatidylinositol transporter protein [Trichomonas vaginalis G3]EAY21809.1 Phosphatidylinositol transfer protein [Trichomonas vaginalis G3]KAI5524236.1 phosphatidylinositol transporter protein [Trichomonas vaginalis G3]|eukprot:XP_001582795.1 Phosphatidylinositol transfer protein [Trichomonas vaginalis G3]